jgi:hypothetical protein
MRVVRVGTHALKADSRTSLWNRLAQHRGPMSTGAGNHRGSVFRELVGEAFIRQRSLDVASWGAARSGAAAAEELGLCAAKVREDERVLEAEVSFIIGRMPFLWMQVDDAPAQQSLRGFIERNAIALLSNASGEPIDPASSEWLGRCSRRESVRTSGIWNVNHTAETYDGRFLDQMARTVEATARE